MVECSVELHKESEAAYSLSVHRDIVLYDILDE